MQGALEGIRVIDLSRILAGPYCTMLLADMGAEVLKVEKPGEGDGSRHWGPPWLGDQSAYFLSVNRNKKSLTLNLKNSKGKEILKRLLADADVLIENFRPGTMQRIGLDYETLAADHPGLIYCSITGYGQTGPYKDRPGFDFMIQAQGGLMSLNGPVDGEPYKVGVAIVDVTAGMFAANAILGALNYRTQTGEGQYIDVALLDTQIAWLINVAQNYFVTGAEPTRFGNAHPNIVPYEIFPTKDGYLALAIGTDNQFQRFCEIVKREDLWQDGRFRTNGGRVKHRKTLIAMLQDLFQERTTEEWINLCVKHNIPAGPINDVPAILNDPQVKSRGMVQELSHPLLGTIKQIGPVARFSKTPATMTSAPPLLGEHTESILREELGYREANIAQFRDEGII